MRRFLFLLLALGFLSLGCDDGPNPIDPDLTDVPDEWEDPDWDRDEWDEPEEWTEWTEWTEWEEWDEPWCEYNYPECRWDSDCGPGYRCDYGPPCVSSSCCYYPDGSYLCSNDCIPICVPDGESDWDGDGVSDDWDNCPWDYNPDQRDSNGNGLGDACDENEFCEYYETCYDDEQCGPGWLCGDPGYCQPSMCCYSDWDEWCTDDCVRVCMPAHELDSDGDGIPDLKDNCPYDFNPNQRDQDGDGVGDVCDFGEECWFNTPGCATDADCPAGYDCEVSFENCVPSECCIDGSGERFCSNDCLPQCVPVSNPDSDGDGVIDVDDNCPFDFNPEQSDSDGDGLGDACDESTCFDHPGCNLDADCKPDGLCDANACQPSSCCLVDGMMVCTPDCRPSCVVGPDADGDGFTDSKDNCPNHSNPDQGDFDRDGTGDACDASSCIHNRSCLLHSDCALNQFCDANACAPSTCCLYQGSLVCTNDCVSVCALGADTDRDGVADERDNCVGVANPSQLDSDGDGIGDACETAP